MNLFNIFRNKNTKYYGHVISLGYNCEVAYQFFKYHKFVESSLFTWTNTINIQTLIYALNNLDMLVAGKLENITPMWQCQNTKICFHGKAPLKIWTSKNNLTQDILNQDREELISRVSYLKNKFIQTANDCKKNLYIFSYHVKEDESIVEIKENIDTLYKVLKNLGTNVFDLLIVMKKDVFTNEIEAFYANKTEVLIRRVDLFASEENVTGKINDAKGWKKIFNEFRPDFKLKKMKKFKFEER